MRFLKPEILWHLLWILPAMLVLYFIAAHKTARTLRVFLGKNAENPDYVLLSKGRRVFRFILLCLAVLCLVVAAARPSWGVQIQELNGQGRDLLFVFDVSRSMLAKDVQPSRLAHAKWLVKELVKLNPGDRFGLIAFAGKGFLECPLTTDRTSFELTLDELSTDSIPLGGTNIQEALAAALQAFKAAETTHRAVILVTDGDELEGNSGKAVDEIVARKIPLFIAGIGDPSQPSIIQVPDGRGGVRTLTDANGNVVNSPLNEKQLGELAKRTGGIYVRSTAGDPGVAALEKRIRALAPHEYETVKTTKSIDRFSYPLAAAFVLLLLRFMVGERPARRKLAACMLFTFCLAASGTEAVPAAEESFNKGVEAHEKNDLKTASESYETALRSGVDQAEIRGRATQNLGVIAHTKARSELAASLQAVQGQNLDEAQKQVENSLKTLNQAEGMYLDSMRESAERNQLAKNQSILLADRKRAEELKKKIEELKKMQQQAQQQTQQAKDQQKKENQKQDKQNQQGRQNQQQQDKQNNQGQQGKQDQAQQNQNRQSAQQMTDQAKKSAEELQKKAQEMGQQNLAKSAEQAKKELEKAQQEQKQGKGESAEEHLKKALDALGGEQSGKDKQDKQQGEQGGKDGSGKDQKPEPQSGKDGKDGQKDDRKIEQPQAQPAEKKPEEGDIDKNQAASVLEDMAKDEKDLRDAIKAYQKQRYKNAAPAKDW